MRVSLLYFNAKISFLEEIHLNKREDGSIENLYCPSLVSFDNEGKLQSLKINTIIAYNKLQHLAFSTLNNFILDTIYYINIVFISIDV